VRINTIQGDPLASWLPFFLLLRWPFQQILNFLGQAFYVGEAAIDGGKADISHPVEFLEPGDDLFPHDLAAYLRFARRSDVALDLVGKLLYVLNGDGPFGAGSAYTLQQFLAVKGFPTTISLDHHDRRRMDAFVGGEALPTDFAFPPTTDAVSGLSRVNNSRIANATVGTFHGSSRLVIQDIIVIRFVGAERISVPAKFVSRGNPSCKVEYDSTARERNVQMLTIDRFGCDDF
jgi:hypothetical protein